MDETAQETFPAETEPQTVETVPSETVAQVTEPVTTDPLPSDEVPATTAATVPAPVSTSAPLDIYYGEDSTEYAPMETVPATTEPVYIEVIETVGSDIVHSSLFGSFLICGTLVGLALFRRIYGT